MGTGMGVDRMVKSHALGRTHVVCKEVSESGEHAVKEGSILWRLVCGLARYV